MKRIVFGALALVAWPCAGWAQSTASQVQPGSVATNGNFAPYSQANRLPTNTAAQGEIAMTVGTAVTAGTGFKANCTVAGNVSVTYANGSTGVYIVIVGTDIFQSSITTINSSGTTATCTYANLQ
jgi:hypothetical protein